MNKAKSDLKRSQQLLVKVSDYNDLCEMTVKELNICQKSYMKVCNYAYKMNIINADPAINFASAIGTAVSISTDTTAVIAADTTAVTAAAPAAAEMMLLQTTTTSKI